MSCFDARGYVAALTDEELCAEVLCWRLSNDMSDEDIAEFVKKNKASSFFASSKFSHEKLQFIKYAMQLPVRADHFSQELLFVRRKHKKAIGEMQRDILTTERFLL